MQPYLGALGDIEDFIQLTPGINKSDEPIIITGIDKIHLKCDCNNDSLVNDIREPILYSFVLDKPPGHKTHKKPRIKLFKKINISVLSLLTFFSKGDDYKLVAYNGETISFTCQLVER